MLAKSRELRRSISTRSVMRAGLVSPSNPSNCSQTVVKLGSSVGRLLVTASRASAITDGSAVPIALRISDKGELDCGKRRTAEMNSRGHSRTACKTKLALRLRVSRSDMNARLIPSAVSSRQWCSSLGLSCATAPTLARSKKCKVTCCPKYILMASRLATAASLLEKGDRRISSSRPALPKLNSSAPFLPYYTPFLACCEWRPKGPMGSRIS